MNQVSDPVQSATRFVARELKDSGWDWPSESVNAVKFYYLVSVV